MGRPKLYHEPYQRTCSKCQSIITYTCRGNLWRAIKTNGVCNTCAIKVTPESSKKISKTLTGRTYPNRVSNTKVGKILPFSRTCPICKAELTYCSKYAAQRANKTNSICNRCASYEYDKTWTNVITDTHVKQMRATKAGFISWKDYTKEYPKKKQYKAEVWKHTYQQPLETLSDWNKRGRCGITNAYQLDHVISVDRGWKEQISPHVIGNIENLRMIPWEENLKKSNK